jgi:protein required for attachment to host cells
MEDMMKAKTTWILIADGAQAKVFEHKGPGKGLQIIEGLQFEQEPLQAREIMADRPGNSIGSQGARNSGGVEYSSDPVAVRERRFVESVAEELEKHLQKGEFERLIVAAAPTALGDLRPAFSKNLRETIVAELPKDLTNIPTPKLEAHFEGILPV